MVDFNISLIEEIVRALKEGKTLTELSHIIRLPSTELARIIMRLKKEGYIEELNPENVTEPVFILGKDSDIIIREIRKKAKK